ncbi:Baeyer-Villiger monooxygenase [Golovinomyces cichoracearum]|uniref:Baeyer-Villiger monooxygenase n=1 Tax=Golovinomyces cichoracearum TaxID=62708 RepID=A0A420IQD4_9PEZI|nr:Baeyer-Villiger monooxygenase [Golovinomyces cichoracearum]
MSSVSDRSLRAKYGNTILKETGFASGTYTYYPVAIIGAGESGITIGCRLKKDYGFDQFRIFDRQSGIGGIWWISRYPGVACEDSDVFYSFPFRSSFKKTSIPPTGSDVLESLHTTCAKYQIVDKIQLNTDVRECRWLESEQIWELTLWHFANKAGDLSEYDRSQKIRDAGHESVYSFEEKIRARVLVSAIGCLIEPNQLQGNIPGSDIFQGEIFNSTRWRHDVDLSEKEIIVVGTGRCATQFVPFLIYEYGARSVTQIMRSPPWVVPLDSFLSDLNSSWKVWSWRLTRNIPGIWKLTHSWLTSGIEKDRSLYRPSEEGKNYRKKVEMDLLSHMRGMVPKKYHEILTPNYELEYKRRVLDTSWLQLLNNPAVTLTTLPLSSVNERDVTLGPGRMYPDPKNTTSKAPNHQVTIPADVIILENEFHTGTWPYSFEVIGRGGKKLLEITNERGGLNMYMGMALDGFPNFFAILGPNAVTDNISSKLASENIIDLSLKLIRPLLEDELSILEIKQEAALKWASETQNALLEEKRMTSASESFCSRESELNLFINPYSQIWFTMLSMFPNWSDWNFTYTSRGLAKSYVRKTLHTVAFSAVVWGIVNLRSRQTLILSVRDFFQITFFTGSRILYDIGSKIR